jgi:hypothetical protein
MANNPQLPNMTEVFTDIEQQIITLAETTVSNFKNQAISDAKNLVSTIKADISRWTNLLSTGQIKISEFEFLVGTEKSLTAMISLEQAGLAQLRIQNYLNGVLNIVIDVVLKKVIGNTVSPAPVI